MDNFGISITGLQVPYLPKPRNLLYQIYELQPRKMSLNYGLDKVRFITPVPADGRVRGVLVFRSFEEEAGGRLKFFGTMTIELEGSDRPACVADFVSLHILDD